MNQSVNQDPYEKPTRLVFKLVKVQDIGDGHPTLKKESL